MIHLMLSIKGHKIDILPDFAYHVFYIYNGTVTHAVYRNSTDSNITGWAVNTTTTFILETKVLINNTPMIIVDIISLKTHYNDWHARFVQVIDYMRDMGYQFNDKLNGFQQEYRSMTMDIALTGKRLTYDSNKLLEYK